MRKATRRLPGAPREADCRARFPQVAGSAAPVYAMIIVATAGWSIPRAESPHFPGAGTHLQRYAKVLRGVEINTSFYRDHAAETYANWARQTPRSFRFAVKVPQFITHEQRLRAARRPLKTHCSCSGCSRAARSCASAAGIASGRRPRRPSRNFRILERPPSATLSADGTSGRNLSPLTR
jgi:hypothetical protein